MPSLSLLLTAIAAAAIVAAAAYAGPAAGPEHSSYATAVKVVSGAVAIAGSMSLAAATGRTLLRSGGLATFKASYVAAAALGGLGLAEVLSALRPANIGFTLAAYCAISIASGAFWVGFYGRAA